MSFSSIKGQDNAVKFLKNSIKKDKVSHAYIFAGPSGIGKKLVAVKFAKALNCLQNSGDMPCEYCISCKKIDSSGHPDVFELGPDKEGGSVKIEKMRSLIKSVSMTPYEGRKKVFIIDGAQSITDEGANALLKTLEEPPRDSVIILITEKENALLPTIVSRSQSVKFYPLGMEETEDILIDSHDIAEVNAHTLAHISGGRPGEALKYRNEGFFNKRSACIKGLLGGTFFESDLDGISKTDFRLYLDIMLTYYRDVLVAKAGLNTEYLVNIDARDGIHKEAVRMRFEDLDNIIKQLALTNSFLDRNVNLKLAIAALSLGC